MMGDRTVMQEALFYGFRLEDHVPQSHLLRSVDRFVGLDDIREKLRPFYNETGRPSIDPELLIRMLLSGYCLDHRPPRIVRKVGWHHCLKCRRPYFSEDVVRLRICDPCREDDDRFT